MAEQIMIVDDEAAVQQMMELVLKEGGYEPIVAGSGEQALEILQDAAPDLIIVDVMMPGMDGIELCGEIRNNPDTQSIPIIILTAKANTDTLDESYNAGADLYLIKPFAPEELLTMIQRLLSVRNS